MNLVILAHLTSKEHDGVLLDRLLGVFLAAPRPTSHLEGQFVPLSVVRSAGSEDRRLFCLL